MEYCPLCHGSSKKFFRDLFFICDQCRGIFRSEHHLPEREKEESRYRLHKNNVNDEGYRNFVSPIIREIQKTFLAEHKGLDFGAGPSSVISHILRGNGYDIEKYDPFFFNHPDLLKSRYNYIICCEVIEHFHKPAREFSLLKHILLPGGIILCMTFIYNEHISFDSWYYKNDFTHVFIYQEDTIKWIKNHFGFSEVSIEGKLIKMVN